MILPTPSSHALARSQQLTDLIHQEIVKSGGVIPFSHFMEMALYFPKLGYYCAKQPKFGSSGDFITAPLISSLFTRCVVRQFEQISRQIEQPQVLEIGAGSGVFAADALLEMDKMGFLPEKYYIYEISESLREVQKEYLVKCCEHLLPLVEWVDEIPQMKGIMFANELLDALPVDCFYLGKEGIFERSVSWQNNHFSWQLTEPDSTLLSKVEAIKQQYSLPEDYQSEINQRLDGWLKRLAENLIEGCILLFDYGYGQSEYYHADRSQGTLMGYYQHHRTYDPFLYVGLQDLTAHVDFTQVAHSAHVAGLELAGYTTQAGFLLSCGLLALAEQNKLDEVEQYKQSQSIKLLTLPSQMGESIKVMALSKNLNDSLVGFTLQDRRRNL